LNPEGESIRFWQAAPLAGVEPLAARYIEHRFVPHVHNGYVISLIMAGAQRYRGAEHLAGTGTLVLINPDELHTGHKGTDDGWLYRAFYPDNEQILSLLAELELPANNLPAFGATLYRDPDLVSGFCQLHRLLESPATALQQQTVWRAFCIRPQIASIALRNLTLGISNPLTPRSCVQTGQRIPCQTQCKQVMASRHAGTAIGHQLCG
jgi:hypothetical protein